MAITVLRTRKKEYKAYINIFQTNIEKFVYIDLHLKKTYTLPIDLKTNM